MSSNDAFEVDGETEGRQDAAPPGGSLEAEGRLEATPPCDSNETDGQQDAALPEILEEGQEDTAPLGNANEDAGRPEAALPCDVDVSESSRVASVFERLRGEGRKGLMPFVCGGQPSVGVTGAVIEAVDRAGASVIEVGIPFSDPIADGPVIAAAMHEALEAGCTPGGVFEAVQQVRERVEAALIAMVSVSIVERIGAGAFVKRAKEAGFDGFIFPDCPLDEAGDLSKRAADAGLTSTLLIAPTTTPERAEKIAQASTGFVYMLARSGITGEQAEAPDVGGRVARVREWTNLPIAVGFGISTPEHVAAVVEHADAAIVGSALVRRVSEAHAGGRDVAAEAGAFVGELAGGLGEH
jgi:tryptophan synthase alpha chain